MSKPSRYSEAVKAYLERLGNPYASLQLFGAPEEEEENSLANNASRPYQLLQNPYAKLSIEGEVEGTREASSASTTSLSVEKGKESLSIAEFRARTRRIFKQYIPVLENGRLRAHHRDFISRNESCSPTKRYRLVRQLEKYDLSNVEGLKARFNREREPLTEEKLKQIERLVDSED